MIYLLLPEGFEEIEALTPVDIFRRCNKEICTVSLNTKDVLGAHNICVKADILIDEVEKENLEMLILPGGPGHTNLKTKKVYDLLNYAAENNKMIGAICAAPSVLGEMGLLDGKKATVYPGFEQYLKGADVISDNVVVFENYITAKGPGAASEFAFSLLEFVCDKNKVREIRNGMQYI